MTSDKPTPEDMLCAMKCAALILKETEHGLPRGYERGAMVETIDLAINQVERFPRPYAGSFQTLLALKERRARFAPAPPQQTEFR